MEVADPIVKTIAPDNVFGLNDFKKDLKGNNKDLIENYPTVYIHNWSNDGKFEVYVGESNDFFQRTSQHYEASKSENNWQNKLTKNDANLYVIAHKDFNKSLTLDVENRLIHYLSSSSSVIKVHNARGNPQNKYYPCEELDPIFNKIWHELKRLNKALFLPEDEIRDSAIFKASPLHKLSLEQLLAKEKILDKIDECLIKNSNEECKLIFVEGNAGTGKTVLMSSIFYEEIYKNRIDVTNENVNKSKIEAAILVNHNEQLTVYREIVRKLDLASDNENIVFKPTQFINLFIDQKNSPKKRTKKFDIVFIDEAHLLFTQKNQSFTGEHGQLNEIMKYAKTVVVMFDRKQIMNTKQYLDNDTIEKYIEYAKMNDTYIRLNTQMRIKANKKVQKWINDFCDKGIVVPLTKKRGNYEIKVFDSIEELDKSIRDKANKKETSLSRLIANYNWHYSSFSRPNDDKYWSVKIGTWSRPWNYELQNDMSSKDKKKIEHLAWAEQEHTINEIGSTYTIQGFDLNYAGVILGDFVKFKDGKIKLDIYEKYNKDATNKRTLEDGTRKSFAEDFLRNELNVLMSRGVNGLYIYACDEKLREQLKKCI